MFVNTVWVFQFRNAKAKNLTNEILPFVTNVPPILDATSIAEEDVHQSYVVSETAKRKWICLTIQNKWMHAQL